MTIPKIAHWIWFGSDIPGWADENIALFRELHPDWTTMIWHELPTDFPDSFRATIDGIPWYSSRSDIFRFWLLKEYGGVFLDTDIVTLRSFNALLEHSFFLAPCLPEGHTHPHLNCALMGCESDCEPILAVLDECLRFATEGQPPKRIAYGPDLLTRLFHQATKLRHDVTILPFHYFYAIPNRTTAHRFWRADPCERSQILEQFRSGFTDNEEPYALHLWGVDGSSQRTAVELLPSLN